MKKLMGAVFVICFCMVVSSALCYEDIPEPGMAPDYEPDGVVIPDEESVEEYTAPVNEPEIEEEADLERDEAVEDSDYNAFEGEISEIQNDQKAIIE